MGGKLGTDKLGQFKLGDSHVAAVAFVVQLGHFDEPTPAAATFDEPTPG